MTYDEIRKLIEQEGKEWRSSAVAVINEIPSGFLVTYGEIARITNERGGHNVTGRNIAWLRRHLYHLSNRKSSLPLHRIACKGDIKGSNDSVETQIESRNLRKAEGSWDNPKWWRG